MVDPERPNCARCRHFFVTWEPDCPRGCRAYGFKSRAWPSQVVLRESGEGCRKYEERFEDREGARETPSGSGQPSN